MKKLISVVCLYFIFISSTLAQYPDTICVNLTKVKGFGPFQHSLLCFEKMPEDNKWKSTVPEYKGIPDTLKNLLFASDQTDFFQHSYQNYTTGKISEEFFNEVKHSLNWQPDESEYSKDFIKVDIGIVAGYDSEGALKIKMDKNNNYDFSDETYFTLPEKMPGQNFWGRYNDLQLFEVNYEFFDGERKTTKAWIYLDYSPEQYSKQVEKDTPLKLTFAFAQHHKGEFEVGGEKYTIAIKSDRAVYRYYFSAKVWNEKTVNTLSEFNEGIQKNGHTRIGNYYYRIGNAAIDGSNIMLIKDASVEERGGNEAGMNAINFSSKSITGEAITLNKLRGNIVLLDFWGTWCAPCREEIPKLKSIYEQYKSKNFILIGIAEDNIEPLVKFIKENQIEWPQIIQEEDRTIISDYNIVGYPTTFLIDADGKILAKGLRADELVDKVAEIFDKK